MALFSRKNRPQDEDTVHLASADHSWWTGGAASGDAGAEPVAGGAEEDVAARIADALEEYGYASEGGASSDEVPPIQPGRRDAAGHEPGADEAALFAHDGLPEEDRLAELLGTLGLEGDADWVDIARAHRRLAGSPAEHRPDGDGETRRRAANEAYACLRLFHH